MDTQSSGGGWGEGVGGWGEFYVDFSSSCESLGNSAGDASLSTAVPPFLAVFGLLAEATSDTKWSRHSSSLIGGWDSLRAS